MTTITRRFAVVSDSGLKFAQFTRDAYVRKSTGTNERYAKRPRKRIVCKDGNRQVGKKHRSFPRHLPQTVAAVAAAAAATDQKHAIRTHLFRDEKRARARAYDPVDLASVRALLVQNYETHYSITRYDVLECDGGGGIPEPDYWLQYARAILCTLHA